jgi:pheromone a factor receptor
VRFFLVIIYKTSFYSILFLSGSKNTKKRPSTFQLSSGWDDMLNDKVSKAKMKSSITISTCSSPVSDDEDFKTSTLSYLGSPTARTLGLSGSPVPPDVAEIPRSRTTSPVFPTVYTGKATDNPAYDPPNSPLPSLPESCYGSRSRSRSPSMPSEIEETISTLTPLLSLFPSI